MASIRLPFSTLNPLLVIIIVCFSIAIAKAKGCVERERVALLDFKKSFASFPENDAKLSSWNISSEDCCGWEEIFCDNSRMNVVGLYLSDLGLKSNHLRPSLLELQHLQTLSFFGNNLSMRIPEFIGSFKELSYLDLSYAGFYGSIPPQLANLSSLEYLFLGPIDLSEPRDWLLVTTKLPLLSTFFCYSCTFPSPDALPTTHFNSSLEELVLVDTDVSSSTISLIVNTAYNLSSIYLDSVHFEVPLLNIIDQIVKLCNLEELSLYSCGIKDSLSRVIQALGSGCASDSLSSLDLSSNGLTGLTPPMLMFPSLSQLYMNDNQLEGFSAHISSNTTDLLLNAHPSHIFPPTLSYLSITDNALRGVLLSEHFANISQLNYLDLTNNPNLTVILSEPPSQVQELHLSSCNLGPGFPSWILAPLQHIQILDLSNSNLSGSLPTIFWSNLSDRVLYVNISSNNLFGVLPNFLNRTYGLPTIDLSSNGFYGTVPLLFLDASELHLSNNKMSSLASIPCPNYKHMAPFHYTFEGEKVANMLDISANNLSGEISDSAWISIYRFQSINLSNNNLTGRVPSSTTTAIYVLNLSNNRFFGQIPSFLKNSTNMRILDLSGNRFSGFIPSWIGEGLNNLVVLSLNSNNLTGTLSRSLCQLRSLQILDLSHNKLSGTIPSCVDNFIAMARDVNLSSEVVIHEAGTALSVVPVVEAQFYQALVKWKGMDRLFHKSLELLNLIDLSSNNFSGEIPGELMSLIKLESLDLSSNNFTGRIPNQIGQLKELEYLNMSFNSISGSIPTGLADVCSLSMLDLSHNNLSGRIPKGTQLQTFNSSAFTANSGLCGEPLDKCPGDADDSLQPLQIPPAATNEGDEGGDKEWFYAGSGAGFACGFLGIIATLTWIKEWRYAFFGFATELGEWILLVLALGASKISRKLRFK